MNIAMRSLLALLATAMVSPAFAAPAAPAGPGGVELIMLVVMMVVFYFFLIRPQQKRAKEHKNLVQSLSKGDEVVTSGWHSGQGSESDR